MRVYEDSAEKTIKEGKTKIRGHMKKGNRQTSKTKKSLLTKTFRVKNVSANFKDIFKFLETAFVNSAIITFERYNLLSGKHMDRKSYEKT